MYVVVSIINRELGVVKLCQTIGEAVEKAFFITTSWAIFKDTETIELSLENFNEYLINDTNDNSEYAVYIGKVEE